MENHRIKIEIPDGVSLVAVEGVLEENKQYYAHQDDNVRIIICHTEKFDTRLITVKIRDQRSFAVPIKNIDTVYNGSTSIEFVMPNRDVNVIFKIRKK